MCTGTCKKLDIQKWKKPNIEEINYMYKLQSHILLNRVVKMLENRVV